MSAPQSYTYQWNRNGTPINGATNQTYTVQAGDENDVLTCTVTAVNSAGMTPAVSPGTGTVPVPSTASLVLGAAATAGTGTVSSAGYIFGSIFNATGSGGSSDFRIYGSGGAAAQTFTPAIYSVVGGQPAALLGAGTPINVTANAPAQWWTGALPNVAITAGQSYMLAVLSGATSGEAGLYSIASGTNYYYSASSVGATWGPIATSNISWIFAVDYAPVTSVPSNTAVPVVEGSPAVGSSVGVSNGTWTEAPSSYTYQWNRITAGVSAPISGATSNYYTPVTGDLTLTLTCTVSAVNVIGASSAVTSAASAAVTAAPAGVTFIPPSDSGMIDVTLHGADNTGHTDCTSIIQNLIANNIGQQPYYACALYFPSGTYLISGSILAKDNTGTWRPQLTLRGENAATTTIKMKDGVWNGTTSYGGIPYSNPGFANSQNVENAMLVTGTYGAPTGNNAFNNYVMDLTFDLGNNPGGGCIGFLVNNVGGIRRCNFKCVAGFIGVDLGRGITGPGIITDCNFGTGFAMPCISFGQDYSYIMERCNFAASTGHYSLQQAFTMGIKDCTFAQPVMTNGGASDTTFWNQPDQSISASDGTPNRIQFLGPGTNGFKIPSVDTPLVPYDPLSQWVNAATHSGGLQGALNSGMSTVYIPANAGVSLTPNTTIPATVNRIICFGNGPSPESWNINAPFFVTQGASSTPLTLEWCTIQSDAALPSGTDQNSYVYLEHSSSRDLCILDWSGCGIIQGTTGGGRIFCDNFFLRVGLVPGNQLYARQWNWEDPGSTPLVNNGGQAWVFGLKTEWGCGSNISAADCYQRYVPTINTTNGGRTDMCVGFSLPNVGSPAGFCQYQFSNSSYALSYVDFLPSGVTGIFTVDVAATPAGTSSRVPLPDTAGYRGVAQYSYNGG